MKTSLNPEYKAYYSLLLSVGITLSAVCFFLNIICGVLCLALTAVSVFFLHYSAKKRYEKIRDLTERMGKILSGDNSVAITSSSEGELSLLQHEVAKMLSQLKEKNEKLEKERLFLSDSIADISHQIRTPLTSINLTVALLQQQNLPEEKRLEKLRELASMINKTDQLVTTLLKISKLDADTIVFDKRKVFVRDLIAKSSEGILIAMDIKNQSLVLDITEEYLHCDIAWTCEAIGNILKNAMEHTPEGGTISVTCTKTPIFTQLVIADTGHGFDKEDLPHIFERFYKGKNSSDNSFGIGLNLASMIIRKQGGTIKADNSKEGSAVFTVRFYETTV